MEFFSAGHLIVLAIVVLVLFFGWKQLPDMARSMGRSMRIFKTEIKGMTEDDKARAAAKEAEAPPKALEAAPVVEAPRVVARPRPTPSANGHRPEVPAQRPTSSH